MKATQIYLFVSKMPKRNVTIKMWRDSVATYCVFMESNFRFLGGMRFVRLTDEHLIKPFNCGNEQKDLDLADFTFLASLCWITE